MSEQTTTELPPISEELKLMREQLLELTKAVHALVKLQSVLNQAVKTKIDAEGNASCAVI